ncbi:MAG TPA: phosphoribosylformylglycinamidine cyclo-ligase [Candidatus Bathyarchaeia archaeon]|nr:phosphoribosylformylglycinamidine cyclo-ligase [Candidatus Bathyarchaeia archaeon]
MPGEESGLSYRDAGVNIDAANLAVKGIKDIVSKTFDDNVLQDIGSFGAMYRFNPAGMEEPVLVSSVDGVGTKIRIAFMMNRHDTVGIDIVSHCVNDILVQGARPLFFLDYLACGRLDPDVVVQVIRGLATGCRYAGCALIGGETAEMPSIYKEGEYDLAGTIVGVVDRKNIVDGSTVEDGDVIIGFPSSGLHTNGYSLARKICFEIAGLTCDDPMPGAERTVGEELLEPHHSYAKMMQVLMRVIKVKGMAHVTGGGITENLPRSMPADVRAVIDLAAWTVPPVFAFLQKTGRVAVPEMLRTFNMGVGYLIIVSEQDAEKAEEVLSQTGQECMRIGRCVSGENGVEYTGSLRYAC